MDLPPTTGAPLSLYVPPFDYGVNPGDDPWSTPVNDNWTILNNFAETVVLFSPATTQTIIQPVSTYLNINNTLLYGTTPSLLFGTSASNWDSALTRIGAGSFTLDANSAGSAGGTLKLNVLNAVTGLQVNGAAPNGHLLVGNGTEYVDSATLPAGLAFYQTIQSSASSFAQQPKLNFLSAFVVANDPGNTSTDVSLAATGVTPGTYTSPTITVNAAGQVTAASNSSSVVGTVTDYSSGGRVDHTTYQNTTGGVLMLSGSFSTTGSSTGNITVSIGATSGLGSTVWNIEVTATVSGGAAPFYGFVPNGWYYRVDTANAVTSTVQSWVEIVLT